MKMLPPPKLDDQKTVEASFIAPETPLEVELMTALGLLAIFDESNRETHLRAMISLMQENLPLPGGTNDAEIPQ